MKNLHIIMPMAGEGKRFKEKGYDIPKPLLKPQGTAELFFYALNSIFQFNDLPFTDISIYDVPIKMTFIVRNEFVEIYGIDKIIHSIYPFANIVTIEKTTRGALETVLLAEQYIDKEKDAVLVMDCDFCFYCPNYLNQIKWELETVDAMPLLMSFYSKFPGYSFAEVETNGNYKYAINVVEKNPVSSYALAGCYFLGSADRFLKCAKKVIKDWENNSIQSKEIYLSLVYNYLIKDIGYKDCVKLIDMNLHDDKLISCNIPEDFEHFGKKNIWDS